MKRIFSSLISIFISTLAFTQEISQQMDALVKAYVKEKKFNGAVLVTQKGTPVYRNAFGYRDAEKKSLHKADDIFQIGSITKQITAAVIMQLQEEGKLSVKDPLSKYFNGFTNGDKINIENLLTHTSGIYNYTNDPKMMAGDVTRHFSRQQMLDVFRANKPDFAPGEKWNYSNSAYSILGYIIEKVESKPYEQVVREKIFAPLGMTNSGFDFTHLKNNNKSKGYFTLATDTPSIAPIVDSTIAYAAGAIYSTVDDLAKWERAVSDGKLLKPATWEAVFTPYKNKYGYGWSIDSAFGKKFTAHSGGIHGFTSYLIRFPKDEVAVILFDNSSSPHLAKISKSLAAIALKQPFEMPSARKVISVDSSILQQYVGRYQLTPTFIIEVTRHGTALKAQATNQPPFDIYAEKNDFFFLKVVDAQLEFKRDESTNVSELILHQNGMQQKALRIK